MIARSLADVDGAGVVTAAVVTDAVATVVSGGSPRCVQPAMMLKAKTMPNIRYLALFIGFSLNVLSKGHRASIICWDDSGSDFYHNRIWLLWNRHTQ